MPETDLKWDEEYDVVTVGSGAGSLTAAIVAAVGGARVLVVEKYHELGGVTALSAGQMWLGPTNLERDADIDDSPEEVKAYMDFLAAGFVNEENQRALIDRASQVLDTLSGLGLCLQIVRGMPDYYYPMAAGSKAEGRYLEVVPFPSYRLGVWEDQTVSNAGVSTGGIGASRLSNADMMELGVDPDSLAKRASERTERSERSQGAGLMANLLDIALEQGVEFRVNTAAVDIVGTERAEGVVTDGPSGRRNIGAHSGVVLGMGAYDWTPELTERYEYVKDLHSVVLPSVTGDHFKLGARLRAAVATTLPQGKSTHFGIHVPGEEWGGQPLYRHTMPGLPHSMVVNRAGKRFGDEAFHRSYVCALYDFDGDSQTFPNWPAWLVFDENFRTKYSIGPIAPGDDLPQGMAVQANTLEELAQLSGINPDGLEETAERFNSFSQSGTDDDFGRGQRPWSRACLGDPTMERNPNLGALEQAPYYAIRLGRVSTGIASAGLKTDSLGQVINIDGDRIPGLFAVGNTAARLECGGGYNSGMAVGRSLVFGHSAGQALSAGITESVCR